MDLQSCSASFPGFSIHHSPPWFRSQGCLISMDFLCRPDLYRNIVEGVEHCAITNAMPQLIQCNLLYFEHGLASTEARPSQSFQTARQAAIQLFPQGFNRV